MADATTTTAGRLTKMVICAKFLGHTPSMHPLAIASPTTAIVEPLVACIIGFYDLIQKLLDLPVLGSLVGIPK